MYDYIKADTFEAGLAERLMNHPLLDFHTKINDRTGVMKDGVYEATYQNLVFTIYPSARVEIKGSLHKFWNDGLHNWNQFTLTDVANVLDTLKEMFVINLSIAIIHNLEFGVNLETPFNPDAFLYSLVVHKKEPFNKMKIKGQGNGREVYYNQYGVKVYNKSLQYKQPNHILRFEKKVMKMEVIGLGVIRLADLGDIHLFMLLHGELIECYDEIIFTDKVDAKLLTKPELKLYDKCRNPLEWDAMTKQKRSLNKGKFNALIQERGLNKYHSITRELLSKSGDLLTRVNSEKKLLIDRSCNRSERHSLPSDTFQLNSVLNAVA
jgi:hypothetical protein